jgi:hypothetical protein
MNWAMRMSKWMLGMLVLASCGQNAGSVGQYEDGTGDESGTNGDDGDDQDSDSDEDGTDSGMPKLDVGPGDGDGDTGGPSCKVDPEDMDAAPPCEQEAPPDSWDPDIQWTFQDDVDVASFVAPLVANLTDDNDDGEVDLCDVPDVVLTMNPAINNYNGHLYVLDGLTGTVHWESAEVTYGGVTQAIGDIDDDGLVEILVVLDNWDLAVYENDGTLKWRKPIDWGLGQTTFSGLGLADFDNDGAVEIYAKNFIADADGVIKTQVPVETHGANPAAVDLDDDGDLELVHGHTAYHHDGTLLWSANPGHEYATGHQEPAIGDLDDDGLPEVLISSYDGLTLIEHDGTVTYQSLTPTGDAAGNPWRRPPMIHDVDGDGTAEFAVSSADHYAAYEGDASILWVADVSDQSGIAAGTAFDFLGAGTAQAMYADEFDLWVFDGQGQALMQVPRSSSTYKEYPTVADVDNDGSAELLVVSNKRFPWEDQTAPGLQVIRDAEDRWVPARRIWNQHSYHVTNVREDGTIPQFESPHWELLNTYRTQAQVEGGGVCQPDPEG